MMREVDVPDDQLRVGDLVKVIGTWRRITAIRPYRGPYDFVIGLADTVPGVGFSLCRGQWTTRSEAT